MKRHSVVDRNPDSSEAGQMLLAAGMVLLMSLTFVVWLLILACFEVIDNFVFDSILSEHKFFVIFLTHFHFFVKSRIFKKFR